MRLYGTIQKVDKERRLVAGYASTEAVDAHGETVLKSAIEAALEDYLEFGNVREMHKLSAVGTTTEAEVDSKGLYIAAHIVDDAAWKKVISGVYKGFSIGGKVLARDPKNKKTITKVRLDEISLVDRPSNPETRFDVWKAAGADPVAKATAALRAADDRVAAITRGDTAKSMYHVSRFAELLESIGYLASSAEDEARFEEDDSEIPTALRDWLKAGLAIFEGMAKEEVAEFIAAAKVKKGIHASAIAASPEDASNVIMKAFAAKDAKIAALEKRVLAEPLPAKTAGSYGLVAISKEDDATGRGAIGKAAPSGDDLIAVLQAMPDEERALLLTKAALMLPRPATMVPAR